MTTPARSDTPTSMQIEFEDNRLLPTLFGEHDSHLARIEQGLGVSLYNRGNVIAISGPADAARIARDVLGRLYNIAENGQHLGRAEVDAALRMAADPGTANGVGGQADAAEPFIQTRHKRIVARSPNQAHYMTAINETEMVFATGPAGTGKTYLAVCAAAAMLTAGRVDRIVLARPAVEAGERLGFLPGDMRDKVDPYMRPLYDALYDALPAEQVVKRLETGEIEVAPLAFMRGRTLSNAFVILDEAQNTSPVQMKMALTRIGENSRMVVTGDLTQIDLPSGQPSGLTDALDALSGVPGIDVINFSKADVVRHELVTRIIEAYDRRAKPNNDAGKNPQPDASTAPGPQMQDGAGKVSRQDSGAAEASRPHDNGAPRQPVQDDARKPPRQGDGASKASPPHGAAKISRPADAAKKSRPADAAKKSRPADAAKKSRRRDNTTKKRRP